jgi:release factor glutamine methyltransferase
MPSASKKVFFEDLQFNVVNNVYEPAEDSFLLADNLKVIEGDTVVDVGTGCGILGIIAAAKAKRVVAIDINPYAVTCAKENAELNRVAGKMLFVQGNLFAPIRMGTEFDVIVFNPPYLPSEGVEADSWLRKAWSGGISGRDVVESFIREAPSYLKPDGAVFLMLSTISNVEASLGNFEDTGLRASVIAQQDLPFFETIVLLKAEFEI